MKRNFHSTHGLLYQVTRNTGLQQFVEKMLKDDDFRVCGPPNAAWDETEVILKWVPVLLDVNVNASTLTMEAIFGFVTQEFSQLMRSPYLQIWKKEGGRISVMRNVGDDLPHFKNKQNANDWPTIWNENKRRFKIDVCDLLYEVLSKKYVHTDVRASNICVKLSQLPVTSVWTIIDWDYATLFCIDRCALNDGRYPGWGTCFYVLTAAQLIIVVFFLSHYEIKFQALDKAVQTSGHTWWKNPEVDNKGARQISAMAEDGNHLLVPGCANTSYESSEQLRVKFHRWVQGASTVVQQVVYSVADQASMNKLENSLKKDGWEIFIKNLLEL
jgi:hypothetical protein